MSKLQKLYKNRYTVKKRHKISYFLKDVLYHFMFPLRFYLYMCSHDKTVLFFVSFLKKMVGYST